MSTNTTTTFLSGIGPAFGNEGMLHSVCMPPDTSAAATFYDGPDNTFPVIAQFKNPSIGVSKSQLAFLLDIQLAKGLTVTTTGLTNPLTLTYR
jgi:hypothetical protein